MTVSETTEQLETQLADMIAAGADLDEIAAAIAAASSETPMEDDEGRPMVPDATSSRGYWSIRDRANGDPAAARDLAEWALAKYLEAQDEMTADEEAFDRERQRIQERLKKLAAKYQRTMDFFAGVLEQYADDYAPGEKAVSLLHGTLRRRKNRKLVAWSEEAALAWALRQAEVDDLAPRRLSKSSVKAHLAATGEVVEFITEVDPPTPYTFVVEPV
jgi:hypothetical protein